MKKKSRRKLTGPQATILAAIITIVFSPIINFFFDKLTSIFEHNSEPESSLESVSETISTQSTTEFTTKPIIETTFQNSSNTSEQTTIDTEPFTNISDSTSSNEIDTPSIEDDILNFTDEMPSTVETTVYEDVTTSFENSNIGMRKVPVVDSLENIIFATLEDSNIIIRINKDYISHSNKFPLTWGVVISSSFDEQIDDKIIELEVLMEEDNYSIKQASMSVLTKQSENEFCLNFIYANEISVTFDGQTFVIFGNVSNSYISLNDMCITEIYYFES